VETIAGNASSETLLLVRGTADVVAASNIGIGCLLIICSSIRDKASLRKVLSGELALMFCFLAVALFNTFNAGTIVDGGPPPPFWIVLILNPLLCIYGLVNNKNEVNKPPISFEDTSKRFTYNFSNRYFTCNWMLTKILKNYL